MVLLIVLYCTCWLAGDVVSLSSVSVDVSLQLRGQTIPNNSLVNFVDLAYQAPNSAGFTEDPTNANGRQTLMCITNLVACCNSSALGDWYYPDGGTVMYNAGGATFRRNRGQHEVINDQQFYGSVRLWRRYTPLERGLFSCELPDTENVVQTLYVNILHFTRIANSDSVSVDISHSGSTTAGETYSLTCSATLHSRNPPLPDPDIPSPTFEWFFGPNGDVPLPFGLTATTTDLNSGTYTSTLQFSQLNQSLHTGNYTCQLGAGSLVNSAMVNVNDPAISVQITAGLETPILGQNGYTLTCGISGLTENLKPVTTYQWTKNNGTHNQMQVGTNDVLSFSQPLRLSDAGRYTCQANVSSPYLNDSIIKRGSHSIILQIPEPTSVILSSNIPNPIPPFGVTTVTLTCTAVLSSSPELDVPVTVNVELTDPSGSPLTTTTLSVSGSTYTCTAMINSFGREQSGEYNCKATVSIMQQNSFISDGVLSGMSRITVGVYLSHNGNLLQPGSTIFTTDVGTQFHQYEQLVCTTDKMPCCQNPNQNGEWFFPDDTRVMNINEEPTTFYSSRDHHGNVNLVHLNNTIHLQTGNFCCRIQDATGMDQELCVNIVSVMISASNHGGTPSVTDSYSLTCYIAGGIVSGITYQWRKVSDNDFYHNETTIQFNALQLSNAGEYYCDVLLGNRTYSTSHNLEVKIPDPNVTTTVHLTANDSTGNAYIGGMVTLQCQVMLHYTVRNESVTTELVWYRSEARIDGIHMNNITFQHVREIDSGSYTCTATVHPVNDDLHAQTFILNGIKSSTVTFNVKNPVQTPVVRVDISRFPNVAPYNTFILSCVSSLAVEINIPLNFTWKRSNREHCHNQSVVSFTNTTVAKLTQHQQSNNIRVIEPSPSVYCYQCKVELGMEGLGDTHKSYNLTINVTSPSSPRSVQDVESKNITPYEATIRWTVTYLEYTPEVYTVHYNGTADNILISARRESGSNFSLSLNLTLDTLLTMLDPGVRYTFYINATNSNGSNLSDIMEFTTMETSSSGVTGLSTVGSDGEFEEFTIIWNLPKSPNGVIHSYTVIVENLVDGKNITNNTNGFNHTYTGLDHGIPYKVTVVPINSAGEGEATSIIGFSKEQVPSVPPHNVTVTRIAATAMEVSWVPLSLIEARGFLSSYTVAYRGKIDSPMATFIHKSVFSNLTRVVITGLNAGLAYEVKVWANTNAGAGVVSELALAERVIEENQKTVGTVVGVTFAIIVIITVTLVIGYIVWRNRNKIKVIKHPWQSNHFKPRHKRGSQQAHDYVTPPLSPLELKVCNDTQEERDDYYFVDTNNIAGEHVKPIPVSEFSSHVQRLHTDRDKFFEMEYESISKHPLSSHSIADMPHNKCKNRFANIFPYDSSRVKLKEIAGDGSDYINASYLSGYSKPKAYIGAQGPMPNTVSDFWRLIWEKKLPTVVMLTRVFEGRKKCEEYWPVNVGESVQPGHGLTTTLTSILPFAEYSLRKMTLTCSTAPCSAPLKVTQFHFTGWPDHGVPQNGVTLINFIKRVRTAHPYTDSQPLLVHCSAGVGRTGAFIVLDSMLQRMKAEENLNIYEFLKQLRAQRVLMVQTQAQYNFIHDALNELILCGDTEITAPNMRIVISRLNKTKDGETGYNRQFELIAQMSPGHSELDYTKANMECNVSKNRYTNTLPNDHFRVMLRSTTVSGSDYINASFVDGYRQRGAYIATQAPMENTVNDFWRMIWDYQSRSIVMLCRMREDGKEACYPYLPEHKGDNEVYGKIKVKLVAKETTTDYNIQQLEVSEDKPHQQGYTSSGTEQAVVKVGVFHYLRWPKHGTPQGTSALLEFIQYINKIQMASGNKPITVMCNDGVGRTGTFICIHAQLERLKTEGVVDLFQSIKCARIQRAGLVPEVHQYILCHNLVADYLDGFDTYANFKVLV